MNEPHEAPTATEVETTLSDEDIETRRPAWDVRASADDAGDPGDPTDAGDDAGDPGDPTDTGDDAG